MFPQRFPHSTSKTVPALLLFALSATLLSTRGCRTEHAEFHLAKLANQPLPILEFPNVDEAQEVISRCGQPTSDGVQPMYTKYYNGPVRRLRVCGGARRAAGVIPSSPKAELAYTEAPLPHRGYDGEQRKSDATWKLQAGYTERDQMITAHRVGVYLPCAGEALSPEF